MQIGQYFGTEQRRGAGRAVHTRAPVERMHAAWDGDGIVGGAGAFPFRLSVPGGARSPCCGTTVVGVAPTHRRRGVLSALMRAQLDDAHERGEPVAALWASEAAIYGRFGYGLASLRGRRSHSPRERHAFASPLEPRGQHAARRRWRRRSRRSRRCTSRPCASGPGCSCARATGGRRGRSTTRPSAAGAPARSASRCSSSTAGRRATRSTGTHRLGAGSQRAARQGRRGHRRRRPRRRASSGACCSTSTGRRGSGPCLPLDHPLFLLLAEPRRMQFQVNDGLWVRLSTSAPRSRRATYADDGELVLEVEDAFMPWNEGGGASTPAGAERTDDAGRSARSTSTARRRCTSAASRSTRWCALRARGADGGAAARADALFRTSVEPWCPEIF